MVIISRFVIRPLNILKDNAIYYIMANTKHESNSHPFIYDLPYEQTQWAQFFEEYKSCTQNQLQKYILKTENERKKWKNISQWECVKICQHIFSNTCYDAEKKDMKPQKFFYETNTILQKNAKNYQKFAIAFCQPISNNREQSCKK